MRVGEIAAPSFASTAPQPHSWRRLSPARNLARTAVEVAEILAHLVEANPKVKMRSRASTGMPCVNPSRPIDASA